MKNWMWLAVSMLMIGLDQGSKYWALHALYPYQPWAIFSGLNLTLVFNSGAAWGFLSHSGVWHHYFFIGFGLIMSLGLAVWISYLSSHAMIQLLALSLILGGALGNVIDRIRFEYVIDFIDVYYQTHHWAVFNIADSSIVLGALMLFFWPNPTSASR